jgi:hypothetical protein
MPRVRTEMAPMTSATSAEARIATTHCSQPLCTP